VEEGARMTKKLVEDGGGKSPLPGVKIIPPEEVKRFVVTQAPKRAAVTGKRGTPDTEAPADASPLARASGSR
jgi:hypothetical protein